MKIQFFLVGLILMYIRIEAQVVNIPDANFLKVLIGQGIDLNNNGSIEVSEAESTDSLYITPGNWTNNSIKNVSGIEAFVNLRVLSLVFCDIAKIDISNSLALQRLSLIAVNSLSAIDVTKNVALYDLEIASSKITNIDVTNNINLKKFICSNSLISNLDLSNNVSLKYLACSGNNLSILDVSKNKLLENLNCGINKIKTLDVSNNTLLTGLGISQNQLTNIDVSKNSLLISFQCTHNNLSNIDVSNNTSLSTFYCDTNKLTSLDISKNSVLQYFRAKSNPSLKTICVANIEYAKRLEGINQQYQKDVATSWSQTCSVSGLLDSDLKDDFFIYPNPSKDLVAVNGDLKKFVVLNSIGREVMQSIGNTFSIKDLPIGVYQVVITDQNDKARTFRLMKE